eukprot:Clim_evm4s25 gene=Clim_evmTU4s25
MGAEQSTEVEDVEYEFEDTSAYHVLGVTKNSPGELCGIEAYFDFITGINNKRLDQENDTLIRELEANVGNVCQLVLYNSRSQDFRSVGVVPNGKWGGSGLLGVSVRFCNFEHANENIWHVLDVSALSPASKAGLVPHSDYIIGSPDYALLQESDFYDYAHDSLGQTMRLYVYNSDRRSIREVRLIPDEEWGGPGVLGCAIAFGYLHRIPKDKTPLRVSIPDQQKALEDIRRASEAGSVPTSAPTAGPGVGAASAEALVPTRSEVAPQTTTTETSPIVPPPPPSGVEPEMPALQHNVPLADDAGVPMPKSMASAV